MAPIKIEITIDINQGAGEDNFLPPQDGELLLNELRSGFKGDDIVPLSFALPMDPTEVDCFVELRGHDGGDRIGFMADEEMLAGMLLAVQNMITEIQRRKKKAGASEKALG